MAVTPPPAGWTQRSTNPQEYEAILDLGNFNKYEVNVNVQTGQRQIYTIDPILRVRSFVGTINADGTTVRQEAWNGIAALPNGQTRLKEIIDASRTAANKIVGSVGTEAQKRSLAEQKEFAKLKSQLPPTGPGSVATGQTNQDQTGPNSGPASGIGTGGGAPVTTTFRNNENFNKSDEGYPALLKYPLTIDNGQDFMVISMFNYKVADVFSQGTNIDFSTILRGGSFSNGAKDLKGSVRLPIPSNLSEANQTGWGDDSLSNLTAGLMGAATGAVKALSGGDLLGATGRTVEAGTDIFKGQSAAKSQIEQQLTLKAAAEAVKKLGINVNPEAYRARVTGTVINPNLELLFNGPKLRSFNFTFKMTPRSGDEAYQIRQIIKFFKKGMAPKRATAAEDAFFLGAPNVFRISFMHMGKPSKSLPTLKTCALINFNVNYTADGFYSSFGDGQPISLQIDMSFAELTPIYNDHYNFEEDKVGFSGDLDGLESQRFQLQPETTTPNSNQGPAQPSRGGTSGVVAPAVPVTGGRNPTAIPGDPGYRPPSPGGGLLEGTGSQFDRRGGF
jgi:hypothetical protein